MRGGSRSKLNHPCRVACCDCVLLVSAMSCIMILEHPRMCRHFASMALKSARLEHNCASIRSLLVGLPTRNSVKCKELVSCHPLGQGRMPMTTQHPHGRRKQARLGRPACVGGGGATATVTLLPSCTRGAGMICWLAGQEPCRLEHVHVGRRPVDPGMRVLNLRDELGGVPPNASSHTRPGHCSCGGRDLPCTHC